MLEVSGNREQVLSRRSCLACSFLKGIEKNKKEFSPNTLIINDIQTTREDQSGTRIAFLHLV